MHSIFHLALVLVALQLGSHAPAGEVPQQVYLWQRAWTEPVRRSVLDHGESFTRIIVLKAEVSWQGDKPSISEVRVDYPALARTGRGIGLALRMGPHGGSFAKGHPVTTFLEDLSVKVITEARVAGLSPSELQLDFDCQSSKLESYRVLVEILRRKIAPVPLVITALPDWLTRPDFGPLAQATDGYVLQVHSLERPKSLESAFTLCDPIAARHAMAKAAAVGVPFQVALPTYGYMVAFDRDGRFIGLSAEGPSKSWPKETRLKEVRADPVQIAALVQEWSTNAPPTFQGIIWYRFPVATDTLNWRWPTLKCMLEQRTPRKRVRGFSRRVEPGLIEIVLVNDGELDISSRLAIKTRWTGARFLAGDGLHGFVLMRSEPDSAGFEIPNRTYRLPADEQQVIGWLRLSEEREVQVEIDSR